MHTTTDDQPPAARGRMTVRRKIAFAIAAALLSLAAMLVSLVIVDVYLHRKFAADAGVNVWGYRGPALGSKASGEQRIVVVGGSTAFGYGVRWDAAFPAVLEQKLKERASGPVTVANLAYNNEGAFSFQYTLTDYEYLEADVVIVYTGYNDLSGVNSQVFRHESPVFKLTGYLPILPVILSEKALSLRYGGDLEAAYWGKKTVFKPGLAARTSASAMEAAVKIGKSLDQQLGRLTQNPDAAAMKTTGECGDKWARYCNSVAAAVQYSLDRGRDVVVVSQPFISDTHVEQQRVLHDFLARRFSANPRLQRVDLGAAVDVKDTDLAFDGMHLTARGNQLIADRLTDPVLRAMRRRLEEKSN
jgi:hypothetical protein